MHTRPNKGFQAEIAFIDSQSVCHISYTALYLRAIHRRGVEGEIDEEWGDRK